MTGVLWVRVSSVEQAKGYSPDAQLRELREAAEKKSIDIVKIFQVAESAKVSSARKQFRELVEFLENEKPDVLVTLAVDRLTRNPEDLHTLHKFIEKGLKVFVVNQGKIISKTSSPSDRFTFLLFGDIAYLDNMQRAERVKMGMNEKARGGIYPSRAPMGYLNVPDPADPAGQKRIIIPDPVRGPLVKAAFDLYAQGGYSLATLRDELNRRGLRQKSTAKSPNARTSVHGLQVTLANPFYRGVVVWDGQSWPGTHVPLISTEIFNRVQARLAENRSYSKPAAKKNFAFKKFLRCGYCHSAITAEEKMGAHKSGPYVYYRCTYGKDKKCPQDHFRQEEIDRMFAENLGQLYIDRPIAEKIREGLKRSHALQQTSDKRELQRLRSEETRRTNHLDLLYQDRLDGTITKEQYKEKQAAIQQELRNVKADIEKLSCYNSKYKEEGSTIIELIKGFKETYLAADLEGKAEILNAVVDRATLRNGDLFVTWKPPFDTLFILGGGVLKTKNWRRERDSNPRSGDRKAVFKTAAFNHSAIPPRVHFKIRSSPFHVRPQGFGDDDRTVLLLVVLEDGAHGAADGQARAVEGMDELGLGPGLPAEADVGPGGPGNRRNSSTKRSPCNPFRPGIQTSRS